MKRLLFVAALTLALSAGLSEPGVSDPSSQPVKPNHTLPDLTGVWERNAYPQRLTDLSFMMPWVAAEVTRRQRALLSGHPKLNTITQCMLVGPLTLWYDAHHIQFLQLPHEIIVLGETDHQVRHIYLNAEHPANLAHSWYGDSVGQWQGDTLVVDTVGFNDKTQLDASGTPHSEALHVVERLHLLGDGKTLEIQVNIDDPVALKRPWVVVHQLSRTTDPFVEEYACAENNKDGKEL